MSVRARILKATTLEELSKIYETSPILRTQTRIFLYAPSNMNSLDGGTQSLASIVNTSKEEGLPIGMHLCQTFCAQLLRVIGRKELRGVVDFRARGRTRFKHGIEITDSGIIVHNPASGRMWLSTDGATKRLVSANAKKVFRDSLPSAIRGTDIYGERCFYFQRHDSNTYVEEGSGLIVPAYHSRYARQIAHLEGHMQDFGGYSMYTDDSVSMTDRSRKDSINTGLRHITAILEDRPTSPISPNRISGEVAYATANWTRSSEWTDYSEPITIDSMRRAVWSMAAPARTARPWTYAVTEESMFSGSTQTVVNSDPEAFINF